MTPSQLAAGLVQGQVIGDHNVVTMNFYGDNGAHVARAVLQPPSPQPLPRPVHLLPPSFANFVDREAELDAALAALGQGVPLEVYGPTGIGKSTLLRVLAHHPNAARPPDGVVFHACQGEPAADVVQTLFRAFYDLPSAVVCADVVVRRHLGTARALVLLDDVHLQGTDLEAVRNAAAGCTFVLASPTAVLLGEGRGLALGPLPDEDARAMAEGWLGRKLSAADRKRFEAVQKEAGGNLRLLKQAMAAGDGRGPAERPGRLLGALLAVAPTAMTARRAAAIVGEPEAAGLLSDLEQQGFVERAGGGYRAAGAPPGVEAAVPEQAGDVVDWALGAAPAAGALDADDRRLVVRAVQMAGAQGRHHDAIRLARAIEGTLALSGDLGSWALVLERALAAAQALGDSVHEAWALHELGSRALALEDYGAAGGLLGRALEMREAAGDQAGAAVTRKNLEVLRSLAPPAHHPPPEPPPPGPVPEPPPPPPPAPPRRRLPLLIGTLAVALLVALGTLVVLNLDGDETATTDVTTTVTTTPSTTLGSTTTTLVALAAASLDQPRIAQGASDQLRTLKGSGFRSGLTATAGAGVTVRVESVSPDGTTATFRMAAARTAALGARDVVVVDGDRSATCSGCLQVTRPPVIVAVKPDRAVVGSTVTVTVTGRSFSPSATVSVSGTGVTVRSYKSRTDGAIEVEVVVAGTAATGRRSLTVDNGDGGTATCACFSPTTID